MKYKNYNLILLFGLVIVTSSAVFAKEYNFDFVIDEQTTKSSNSVDSADPHQTTNGVLVYNQIC